MTGFHINKNNWKNKMKKLKCKLCGEQMEWNKIHICKRVLGGKVEPKTIPAIRKCPKKLGMRFKK